MYLRVLAIGIGLAVFAPKLLAAPTFPTQLPPSNEFRLTLREDARSKLPLGPACGGVAARTLTCRAFTVTLKNIGPHTVRISEVSCADPSVSVEGHRVSSTSGWLPLGHRPSNACQSIDFRKNPAGLWKSLRLRPGGHLSFSGRLLAPPSAIDMLQPGDYTLRATWVLFGCTEDSSGNDCLAPLQVVTPGSSVARVDAQQPIFAVSNEITASAPPEPDLGAPAFSFSVTAHTVEPKADSTTLNAGNDGCTTATAGSIDCILFHLTIRNIGAMPTRSGRMTCSDFSMLPEYRQQDGSWKALHSTLVACTMNFMAWTPMLPGQSVEGDVTLRRVPAGFDISPVHEAGNYEVRISYAPYACVASPDGSFCLTTPKVQPVLISDPIQIHTTASLSPKPNPNCQVMAGAGCVRY